MNADHAPFVPLNFAREAKTGVDYRRIFCSFVFREIVMTSSSVRHSISRVAIATAFIVTEMFCNGAALASQGPGGGMGTAGHLTQVAMAVLVYGGSALIVGAGLIGAARGR
jgi:hypothetical protein